MIPDFTAPKLLKIPSVLEILNADTGAYRPFPLISQAAARAVFRRDLACCKFCGQLTGEYNQVLGYGGTDRDLDSLINSCAHCWQCFDLEGMRERKSADLVHCPEVGQARLNRMGFQVRILRISGGKIHDICQAIDTALAERARLASDRLGQGDLLSQPMEIIRQVLLSAAATDPEFVAGLRLWPNGKWNDKRGELTFNRYPQMIASWRSDQYGVTSRQHILDDPDSPFWHALRLFAPQTAQIYETFESGNRSKLIAHNELASKLLRDAAFFFETIGGQNGAVSRELAENAKVFKQVADLNEVKPVAHVGDDTKKPTHAALAAILLRDVAKFFEMIGFQNPTLRVQMEENAKVFRQVADLVEQVPTGIIEE